jgi:hypothetical protein
MVHVYGPNSHRNEVDVFLLRGQVSLLLYNVKHVAERDGNLE